MDEVEEFIEEHHHLPGIPSTEEIESTGVDLGEMNRLLLEKVEELTLYMIRQKQVEDQLLKENRALIGQDQALENKK